VKSFVLVVDAIDYSEPAALGVMRDLELLAVVARVCACADLLDALDGDCDRTRSMSGYY